MRRNYYQFVFVVLIAAIVALATPSFAQAQSVTKGPITSANKIAWEAPSNITSVTQAQSFEPRFYRNGTPLTALTNVTCSVPKSGVIACTAPISQSNLDALNQVGVHSLTLSLYRQDVGEGPQSAPFTLTTPAGAPTNGQITQ